jgi:hypothetical protein
MSELVKRLREEGPVTQDMASTHICALLDAAADRIEELEAALNAEMLAALEQLYTAANNIAYRGMMPMSQGGFIDASKGLAPALMNAYAALAKAKGQS